MPTQPIVMYKGEDESQSDKLAKVIMMEKMGQGIAGASDLLNKGIESYQRIKANKQATDLGAINAAAALVGGHDKLPVETRNKLPGILNIDLPRDDQGDVVLTPSAQTVLDRATAQAAKDNPEQFARVRSGLQGAARDPQEVALDAAKNETTRQSNILDAEQKEADRKAKKAQEDADRAQKERENIRTVQGNLDVAAIRGPTAASARAAELEKPSDFWIDKRPGPTEGNTISKAAAEQSLKPDEKLEDAYWNPSHRALKEHNDARTAGSRVKRAESATELDRTRKALMEARVRQIGAKDPEGLKSIMGELHEAQIVYDKGGPAAKHAKDLIDYWNKELINKLGGEADPKDYAWMLQYLDVAKNAGNALLELATGRGVERNIPPKTAEAAPTNPLKGGAPTPGDAASKLNALADKYRKK